MRALPVTRENRRRVMLDDCAESFPNLCTPWTRRVSRRGLCSVLGKLRDATLANSLLACSIYQNLKTSPSISSCRRATPPVFPSELYLLQLDRQPRPCSVFCGRGSAMRAFVSCISSMLIAVFSTACTIVPDLPPDLAFPMREILLYTACELQVALTTFDTPQFKRFNARKWLITVALNPKTDAEITPAGGLTNKVPALANATRFVTWALNSPGLQLDVKTERSGGVGFNFKSSNLIDDRTLSCELASPSYHVLSQHLGIREWLSRSIDAMYVTGTAALDKPTYNSDITIKFSANGSYTYTFPAGTNLASLSGSYAVDEQLNITFAPLNETAPFKVVTLPRGGKGFEPNNAGPPPSSTAVQDAQVRTDLIAIEQAIKRIPSTQ